VFLPGMAARVLCQRLTSACSERASWINLFWF
jgi:hypothetical protein